LTGTSTQIGALRLDRIDELHPEFPLDMYSANKCVSEKYTLLYGNAYGLNVSVVRLVNIYGPRSNIANSDLGFLNYFIGLALQQKPIRLYGDGKQVRNVLFIDDAVQTLITAALHPASRQEVYFAAAEMEYSVAELAAAITEVIGGSIEHIRWPASRKIIEVGDVHIDTTKIRTQLGWAAVISLKKGLQKTKQYYSRYHQHYIGVTS
jgi:UDP-glucose 4-epimerase